ncbi:undecaprenyl/decaprenyl-phosphate alpha-N-acetylglucosaminyl 1-phosphate transferase, partial [Candidatus Uhrbacteria bacterium]|nr:undecaprenyl/decaprenyl-phosphate alpha-N-acetylglucosaminyl 1-phosphate transferase [Candidatus Uhrbacteria bacterium]
MFLSSISFFLFFLGAAVLTAALMPGVRSFALRLGVIDRPELAPDRKIHRSPTPLLGGIAIFLAFFVCVFFAYALGVNFQQSAIQEKHLIGIFIGATLLMIGGFLDDRYHLSPARQFIFPFCAVIVVIASGIGIAYITHPFGGQIMLDGWQAVVLWFHKIPYRVTFPADLFTLVWLLGMMYTMKFLDGLDGLASGMTVIGALVVALLALDPVVGQPATALLAFILAGSFFGFLPWNWNPAKIFLGEGGSLLAGFLLGTLAIISGSKVTTTALVVGIPILDTAWVILRRIIAERHSPFLGDRRHLHHRLLDLGLSQRAVVGLLYFFAAYFGVTALFLQSRGKLLALMILSAIMLILGVWLVYTRIAKRW